MSDEYQSIEVLIDEIKETTGALSGFLSRMSGVVILFVVLGVIFSQIMFK